ncbi:MAG: Xaa-Pro peptidase family protein [Bacteroidales bacterium]|jgi:Xaa-Pro aminopeptidase|nr:Xaa-Pro peptidase family protein [Bacteroidales bacterium]
MKEYSIRMEKVRQQMRAANVDAFLITTNVNLFYLTGGVLAGYLYIPVCGEAVLFVRRPAGLRDNHIVYVRKPEDIPAILLQRGMSLPCRVMLEGDSIPYGEWMRYAALFPESETVNGTPAIRKARSVKTAYEIDLFRRSGVIHAEVYRKIPALYRPGMTDVELSIEIERQLRLAGSFGIFRTFGQSMEIFVGSLLSGDNAAEPSPYDFGLGGKGQHPSLPIGANNTILRRGTSVMVDMGGNFTGYMTDMTRTYSIGTLPEEAYLAHQTALDIQSETTKTARPGVACETLYNRALEMAKERGLADCFMGINQQAKFIGHGVGIEINELPVLGARSETLLEEGMILALEPKFVIAGVGAVGIENTFLITASGMEQLTLLEENIVDLEKGY